MAFAYHILAHKAPDQVARLIRALQHPDDWFVLHFDRRAPRPLHALGRELTRTQRNVILQPARAVTWGGPAIAEIQIEAMDLLLRRSGAWSHFVNLTGQDFPLRPRRERLAVLEAAPNANYLSWFKPLETRHWCNARARVEQWHLHSPLLAGILGVPGIGRHLRAVLGWRNRLPALPLWRRRLPAFFTYFGGSNYAVLTRAACRRVARTPEARRIRRWLRHAGHPDEIVYQSVLLNSALAPSVVNRDWREIDFAPDAPHPRVFTSADWPRLAASENLFARKFDPAVDAAIIDRLEARVLAHP